MVELKTRLIDGRLIQYGCFSQPKSLLRAEGVVSPRVERIAADAGRAGGMLIFVTAYQRVLGIEGVVDARTKTVTARWQRKGICKRDDVEIRIEYGRVDYCLIVGVALFEI